MTVGYDVGGNDGNQLRYSPATVSDYDGLAKQWDTYLIITNEASPQTDEMYFGGRSVLVDNPRGVGSGRAGNW
jgi:hypothetical protein